MLRSALFTITSTSKQLLVPVLVGGIACFALLVAFPFIGSADSAASPGAFNEAAKLVAGDGSAFDQFGFSVAISGDYAIVGANRDDNYKGSAYIFVRNGTSWSLQQKLTASDGAAEDNFGWSVAISGDTAVVGSYLDDGAATDHGSAYVFVRNGSVWSEQQKLTSSDGSSGDQFGISITISGETAIIGASGDDSLRGSVYVFVRSGASWSQQQKLTASDGTANDEFGWAVGSSQDSVAIGSPGDEGSRGSVFVFTRSGSIWVQQQKLTAGDADMLDQFGYSVTIDGDTVAAGSVNDDFAGAVRGSAYVFTRSGSAWSQQQKLTASDGAANDLFGTSVAVSGDTLLVGANGDDIGSAADQGSVYVYGRTAGTWTEQQKLIASDGGAGDNFGGSVTVDGENAAVGSYLDDPAGSESGSAYVFRDPSAATPTPTPTPSPAGIEGDVSARIHGDGSLLANDVVQLRRFIVGEDSPSGGANEFQRADIAPISTLGNAVLDASDMAQIRRYVVGFDPPQSAGGPTAPGLGLLRALTLRSFDLAGRRVRVDSVKSARGETITVKILSDSLGEETAASFTIEFDHRDLGTPRISLGKNAPDNAVLSVNDAVAGRIGVLIDGDRPITAGKDLELLTITFEISTDTQQSDIPLRLTNGLAIRGISDTFGNTLPAQFSDGAIQLAFR